MLTKQVSKSEIEKILKELPDEVDVEEMMYRLYLLQKIQSGEADIREGRTFSHSDFAGMRRSKKVMHFGNIEQ